MRHLPLFIFSMVCASLTISAQNTKIDTLIVQQNEYFAEPPHGALTNKTFGLEFNPLRLIIGLTTDEIGNHYTHLSGGVSLFAVDRRAEIAFPFVYMFGEYDNIPWKLLNFDATYRRFFHPQQNGCYYSAGIRYTFIEGEEVADNVNSYPTGKKIEQNKVGVFVGIGYRFFSEKGWYWGTSIIGGHYFSNDNRDIVDVKMAQNNFIVDFEILKFGYAF